MEHDMQYVWLSRVEQPTSVEISVTVCVHGSNMSPL